MADTLFDFDPATGQVAEEQQITSKDLRTLLLAGLVATIEEEVAREESGIDPSMVDRLDVPLVHTRAWYRVRGMRAALGHVRRALETREEWLLAAEERGQQPPTADHLECARHRDGCARCEGMSQEAAALQRERDNLEQVRALYVQHIHLIVNAMDDPQRSASLAQVRSALKKTLQDGDREWRRGLSRG